MSISKIINHPSLSFASDLKALCEPLTALNIEYFSHVRVDEKNRFSALGLQPDFVKLYFEKSYYNFDIHMVIPSIPEQYILWDTIERDKETKELYEDFKAFNLGHTFTIIKNHKFYRDCYHFSTKLGNTEMNPRYLEQIDLLKKFIYYFTEKVSSDKKLSQAYKIQFNINDSKGAYFTKNQFQNIDYAAFHQKTSLEKFHIEKDRYLTQQEWLCLHWLSQGKTFSEVAIILGITERTIKAHVNRAKEKFDCTSLFQLGMEYKKFANLNGKP